MYKDPHLGGVGEWLATSYFQNRGYAVLETNWRYARFEIDLIVARGGVLHIVEVKARASDRHGLPEDSVNSRKIKGLMQAGSKYMYLHPEWMQVQYDVLSIRIFRDRAPEFFLIEDIWE
jgi:putative endonuclease